MESEASHSTGLIGLLAWIEVNKKRLLIGSGAGLLVVLLAFLFIQRQAQKETSASQALSEVKVPFSAAAPVPEGTVDGLLKVANDYRGTKAAPRALLLSAGILFGQHTASGYAEAQKRFNQVLQEYPNSPWTAEANLGLAATLAAQGKTNDAINKYEEVRKRFTTSPIIDEAKLALARLYESQKPDEAFRLYEELLKAGGGMGMGMQSGLAMEANMHQEELLKKHPELAKLKEPPPAPVSALPPPMRNLTLSNAATVVSNAASTLRSNVQRITLTNLTSATSSPVQIQITNLLPGVPNK